MEPRVSSRENRSTDEKENIVVKLTALYRKPPNAVEFDRYYESVHLPLALKLPGLRKLHLSKVQPGVVGESPYHFIADLYFDDMDTLKQALSSPEGKAAGKDVSNFAKDIIEMLVAEVEEKSLSMGS